MAARSRIKSIRRKELRRKVVFLTGIALSTVYILGRLNLNPVQATIAPTRVIETVVVDMVDEAYKENSKWGDFVKAVDTIAPMYGYPKNVILAQAALESGRGTSNNVNRKNNYLGIGAFDTNPENAYSFDNPERCVIEYMRIIEKNFPEAWAQRDNPEALLKALKVNSKGRVYDTDKNYVEKVMNQKEWNY